ncbi:MAG: helix-turn-helix transcriptional regulator [Bacilli bacterium]|nr:helix-turn-helix transcriptional regulator [Bacilli bacterium]
MEKEINQQELLAKNLAFYRKASGLTQLELAEKFNYSDKSVSKWERGEGFPDVFVLKSLADFYGISVDDFYLEEKKKIASQNHSLTKQVYIKLLSVGIGWLVTLMAFFGLTFLPQEATFKSWLNFVYGTLITGIILLVWDFIYHHRLLRVFDTSIVIWTGLLSLYLTILVVLGPQHNYPLLFLVGIPLEVLEILWFLFRRNKKKAGTK